MKKIIFLPVLANLTKKIYFLARFSEFGKKNFIFLLTLPNLTKKIIFLFTSANSTKK